MVHSKGIIFHHSLTISCNNLQLYAFACKCSFVKNHDHVPQEPANNCRRFNLDCFMFLNLQLVEVQGLKKTLPLFVQIDLILLTSDSGLQISNV